MSQTLGFTARVIKNTSAREIVTRDRARAQKLLAGLHPHGPAAFHQQELRRRSHHPHKRGHHVAGSGAASGGTTGGSGGTGTGTGGGTGAASGEDGDSIDVTDAG